MISEDVKIIKLLKGLFKQRHPDQPSPKNDSEPAVIPRAEHSISRKQISPHALKVLYRLHEAGFAAYLVGGCVRDLLLGHHPKDFDIATDARPEEVRRLFKNCRLIGKRFRLAHILFGREIIEVATFRTHHENAEEQHAHTHKGMIVRDNAFGPIEDDAERRDFTINALYYNIADFSVIDYARGMEDIHARTLRMIGNPEKRYHEDPVRLLRAVRFMGKLKLNISPATEEPIKRLSYLLAQVAPARLYQEVLKFFAAEGLSETFKLLRHYKLFEQLFPQTASFLDKSIPEKLIEFALTNSDERLNEDKTVSPAFLFAVFLWHPIKAQVSHEENQGFPVFVAYEKAIHTVLKKQTAQLAIPKQLQMAIRDICFLQVLFNHRHGNRPYRALQHLRYRAAYDLLILRTQTGEIDAELSRWWAAFNNADSVQRENILKEINKSRPKKHRRSRKFSRKKSVTTKESSH